MQQSGKSQAMAPLRPLADLKSIRGKKREISVRYAWQACQRAGKISKSRMMTLRRLGELERLYAARQCLIDDDAGREYLEIAAHHIAHLSGEVEQHIVDWCRCWAPWLSDHDANELARRVAAKPCKWKAGSLGNELNLTPAERETLNIATFRPAGWSKGKLDKANREKRVKREKERRQRIAKAEGRILRARPGRPRSTAKPWEALNMSHAAWYRHGKPPETNIRAHQSLSKCKARISVSHTQDCNVVSVRADMTNARHCHPVRRGRNEPLKAAA